MLRFRSLQFRISIFFSYRKGREDFAEYAEPLIHLSGFLVNVVKTEKISEARELVELIEKTNIIGVAGGDGTLMEVSVEHFIKLVGAVDFSELSSLLRL